MNELYTCSDVGSCCGTTMIQSRRLFRVTTASTVRLQRPSTTYRLRSVIMQSYNLPLLLYLYSLFLQSSAVEQVLDIRMDIMSSEIADVVSPCLPRGLWSHIVIRVFLLLGTVCLWHPPYPVLPSCPLSRAFPYPQPGNAGGRRSAPAVCQLSLIHISEPTRPY